MLKDNNEVIEFLELDKEENKKNINDLKVIMNEKDKIKLDGVPTMFINGEKISNDITVEEFENKIQDILNAN